MRYLALNIVDFVKPPKNVSSDPQTTIFLYFSTLQEIVLFAFLPQNKQWYNCREWQNFESLNVYHLIIFVFIRIYANGILTLGRLNWLRQRSLQSNGIAVITKTKQRSYKLVLLSFDPIKKNCCLLPSYDARTSTTSTSVTSTNTLK